MSTASITKTKLMKIQDGLSKYDISQETRESIFKLNRRNYRFEPELCVLSKEYREKHYEKNKVICEQTGGLTPQQRYYERNKERINAQSVITAKARRQRRKTLATQNQEVCVN